MERNRSWAGAGHETQRSLGGCKAGWIGDSIPPIQSLRVTPTAKASKTFPIAAGTAAAANARGERVTTTPSRSDPFRNLREQREKAKLFQIRVRSIRY